MARSRRAVPGVAEALADGFLLALGGRVLNEVLGLLRRQVALKERQRELLEAATQAHGRRPTPSLP